MADLGGWRMTHNTENEMENAEYVERDGKKYPWVEVRDEDHQDWLKRILLADFGNVFICVHQYYNQEFIQGDRFNIARWRQMRPIPRKKYRPYETLEECKPLIGETLIQKGEPSIKILISSVRVTVDASGCFVRIVSHGNEYTMRYLLDHFTHNGQPCGVEV
jgi:hypothetical protein